MARDALTSRVSKRRSLNPVDFDEFCDDIGSHLATRPRNRCGANETRCVPPKPYETVAIEDLLLYVDYEGGRDPDEAGSADGVEQIRGELSFRFRQLTAESLDREADMQRSFLAAYSRLLLNPDCDDPLAGQTDLWRLLLSTHYPRDVVPTASLFKRSSDFLDKIVEGSHVTSSEDDPWTKAKPLPLLEALLGQCARSLLLSIDVEVATSDSSSNYDSIEAIHNRLRETVDGVKNFKGF